MSTTVIVLIVIGLIFIFVSFALSENFLRKRGKRRGSEDSKGTDTGAERED